MKKYKVEFIQTETFIVDLYAENEQEATDKAQEHFDNGDYQEMGDCAVSLGTIYNVTETDDPFYPVNENDLTSEITSESNDNQQ